jgi:hypothetical protein
MQLAFVPSCLVCLLSTVSVTPLLSSSCPAAAYVYATPMQACVALARLLATLRPGGA